MATEIKVPTLGESVTSATIARWMKHEGDTVAADEPLVELETDKVTVEVNAPAAGVLTSIAVPEGSEVEVGAVLATLEAGAKGAALSAAPVRPAPPPQAQPPQAEPARAQVRQEASPALPRPAPKLAAVPLGPAQAAPESVPEIAPELATSEPAPPGRAAANPPPGVNPPPRPSGPVQRPASPVVQPPLPAPLPPHCPPHCLPPPS